jgi:hypothetical protein
LPKKSGKQVPLLVTVNKPRRNRADVRAGTDEQKDGELKSVELEIVLPGRHISALTRTRDSESAYVNHRHNRYSCSPPLFPSQRPELSRSALVIPSAINHVLCRFPVVGTWLWLHESNPPHTSFGVAGVKRTYSFSSSYASHPQTFVPYFPAHGYIISHTIGTQKAIVLGASTQDGL